MKKNSIRKLTIAGVLVAVAVVGSLFSIPVLGAKCSPVQHMVNVLGAVLLGPWYALGMGFAAALIRNVRRSGFLPDCRIRDGQYQGSSVHLCAVLPRIHCGRCGDFGSGAERTQAHARSQHTGRC